MNKKKIVTLLLAAICLAATAQAYPGVGPIKRPKPTLKKNLSRQVSKNVRHQRLQNKSRSKQINLQDELNTIRTLTKDAQVSAQNKRKLNGATYHPIFGYVTPLLSSDLAKAYPVTSAQVQDPNFSIENRLIQTEPILTPVNLPLVYISAFSHTNNLSAKELAQATYLYRLAYPTQQAGTGHHSPYLAGLLNKAHEMLTQPAQPILSLEELPSLQLLARLQDPSFIPNSYAEMSRLFAQNYPKHVTLNKDGIPVKTAQEDIARLLDTYLMLFSPQALGKFNNTNQGEKYAKFLLTPEEREAAHILLASRLEAEAIPNNPTPRDIIELAYNRLESHTVPYTQAENVTEGYQAYPNYKHTSLYNTLKGMIEPATQTDMAQEEPGRTPKHNGFPPVEADINHLIVLDCIMGGIEPNDLRGLERALRAFNDFSASLRETPENIAHVRILQQNLRLVFAPVIEQYRNAPANFQEARDADVGWNASWLLERYNAEELVGRDFRPRSH